MTLSRLLLAVSIAVLPQIPDLRAQVDQEHWWPAESNVFFSSYFGLQQEFTPTLTAIDSAQFSSGQNFMGATSRLGGPVALNIRQGGVGGIIIAASSTVYVPPAFHGDIVFTFTEPVSLVPGQLYAMEPSSPTGATISFDANGLGFAPSYEGGRLFYNGQFEVSDLIFREGIGVPEPAPLLLLAVGGIGATLVWNRTSRRPVR